MDPSFIYGTDRVRSHRAAPEMPLMQMAEPSAARPAPSPIAQHPPLPAAVFRRSLPRPQPARERSAHGLYVTTAFVGLLLAGVGYIVGIN